MLSTVSVTQLQAYLRYSAQQQSETIRVPPFTLFLSPSEAASQDNHAVPDEAFGDDVREPLARLRATCAARFRRTRVRFLEEIVPYLAPALRAEGMVHERSVELLACTPASLIPAPEVPGLSMVTLDASSALDDVREGLDTNERGFDPQAEPATDAQAQAFREGLVASRAFIARINGEPAAAGMFNPPYAGVTELVGITTVSTFRRRGIAAHLTAYMACVAFERGVELVYLSTDNAVARRVYERLGFRPYATLRSYVDSLPER